MDKPVYPPKETIPPWQDPEVSTWTTRQRKKARQQHLLPLADDLDAAGVPEYAICRFLSKFSQEIGDGSYDNWLNRIYLYAQTLTKKNNP